MVKYSKNKGMSLSFFFFFKKNTLFFSKIQNILYQYVRNPVRISSLSKSLNIRKDWARHLYEHIHYNLTENSGSYMCINTAIFIFKMLQLELLKQYVYGKQISDF